MALTPADFLVPDGDLIEAVLAVDDGPDATEMLLSWIADAEARATAAEVDTDGELARAWVYHRAYRFLSRQPAAKRVSVDDEGSVDLGTANYAALAESYRLAAGVLAGVNDVAPAPLPYRSVVVSTTPRWYG